MMPPTGSNKLILIGGGSARTPGSRSGSQEAARRAMLLYPAIGEWKNCCVKWWAMIHRSAIFGPSGRHCGRGGGKAATRIPQAVR